MTKVAGKILPFLFRLFIQDFSIARGVNKWMLSSYDSLISYAVSFRCSISSDKASTDVLAKSSFKALNFIFQSILCFLLLSDLFVKVAIVADLALMVSAKVFACFAYSCAWSNVWSCTRRSETSKDLGKYHLGQVCYNSHFYKEIWE